MSPKPRRLTLRRETLRQLNDSTLSHAVGATGSALCVLTDQATQAALCVPPTVASCNVVCVVTEHLDTRACVVSDDLRCQSHVCATPVTCAGCF